MVYYHALICFCALLVIATVAAEKDCLKVECPGPLAHYRSLGCTPIYRDGECCAWQYNCDKLYKKIRSRTKCYLNGHEYKIGERIRSTDANACEENCTCTYMGGGFADFNCPSREEICPPYNASRKGCYQIQNILSGCCPKEEYCPKELGEERRTFMNYGRTYLAGDYLVLKKHPKFVCIGRPTGEIVCSQTNRWFWSDIHAETGFNKRCAPVYLLTRNNLTDYRRHSWRCQNAIDAVLDINYPDPEKSKSVHGPLTAMHCPHFTFSWFSCPEPSEPCRLINPDGPPDITWGLIYGEVCQFGQLTMHIGDTLNNIAYDVNSCIACVCEVPPVPTCILLQNVSCHEYSSDIEKFVFGKKLMY